MGLGFWVLILNNSLGFGFDFVQLANIQFLKFDPKCLGALVSCASPADRLEFHRAMVFMGVMFGVALSKKIALPNSVPENGVTKESMVKKKHRFAALDFTICFGNVRSCFRRLGPELTEPFLPSPKFRCFPKNQVAADKLSRRTLRYIQYNLK